MPTPVSLPAASSSTFQTQSPLPAQAAQQNVAPTFGESSRVLADASGPAETSSSPFRQEALQARFAETEPEALPHITGSRWGLLALLLSVIAVLMGAAWFGQVEVTSRALGGLRVEGGPTPVTVQVAGVVSNLSVQAGDRVVADQRIARVEVQQLSAALERTTQQVNVLREESVRAKDATEKLRRSSIGALEQKRHLLWQRAKLKKEQVAARQAHAERIRELAKQGAASQADALVADDAARVAREELLALRQQAAETGVQIADRQHSFGAESIERDFRVKEAEVGLAEAETLAILGDVRAPHEGRVESLLVSEGEVIQPGAIVARIVPDGKTTSVVVFAPAQDAAFLREGLSATLEFPSLSVTEYGKATATVTRVGRDLALPAEVASVLGTEGRDMGAMVRVELSVKEDATWKAMQPYLGSGARAIARLQTRKQRILSLLFDFLRTWFE